MATEATSAPPLAWPSIGEGFALSEAQLPPASQTPGASSPASGTGTSVVVVSPVPNSHGNNHGWEFVDDVDDTRAPLREVEDSAGVVVVTRRKHQRPRSKTMGGDDDNGVADANAAPVLIHRAASTGVSAAEVRGRSWTKMRRCLSAPDLAGNGREVFILEEASSEEGGGEENLSGSNDEEEDMEVVEQEEAKFQETVFDDSFEVLDKVDGDNGCNESKDGEDSEDEEEPVVLDRDEVEYSVGESATLVSNFSDGSATLVSFPSTVGSGGGGSAWGSGRSFKDVLSKNAHHHQSPGGVDKAARTEAMLKDSHRKHRLRVRTKTKLVVQDVSRSLQHAHSTGDLTGMVQVEKERQLTFGKRGRHGGQGRDGKGFGALNEVEEEDCGFGGGGGFASPLSPSPTYGEVMGDTDAMDYYHRKERGSTSTVNKKKERPDEAKRREIIMQKKDIQRKNQAEKEKQKSSGSDGTNVEGGKKKKKKNDKGFGGKKERTRFA